jgi:hypothetical protein
MTIRRGAALLTGTVLLGVTAVTGGASTVAASGQGAGITALEFQPTDYPQCAVGGTPRSIRSMVNTIVANSPGSFDDDDDPTDEDEPLYRQPIAGEREDVRAGLHALIDGDSVTATDRLQEAGYRVCGGRINDTLGRELVLVYHPTGLSATASEGAPMLVLAPGQMPTATVLSGPHLTSESRVKNQILEALARSALGYVRGAVLAGTDRCNRLAEAPPEFQGQTGECGGTYRISDMAHNIDTVFQDMHDVLRDEYPLTFNVQLHGMSASGISVSRGNDPDDGEADHPEDAVTRAHSYAEVELKDLLEAGGLTSVEENHYDNLTSCTPYVHSNSGIAAPTRDLHCGTRNAQLARERALGAGDRFIHIEQSLYLRQNHPNYIIRVMYGLFSH